VTEAGQHTGRNHHERDFVLGFISSYCSRIWSEHYTLTYTVRTGQQSLLFNQTLFHAYQSDNVYDENNYHANAITDEAVRELNIQNVSG
jgi:hypothetical protein